MVPVRYFLFVTVFRVDSKNVGGYESADLGNLAFLSESCAMHAPYGKDGKNKTNAYAYAYDSIMVDPFN